MYFFNVNQLSKDLARNRVSERDKAIYFALLCAVTVLTSPLIRIYEYSTVLLLTETLGLTVLGTLGIWLTYKTNQAGDGRRYLDRFVCLSWPVLLWTVLISFVLEIPYSIYGYMMYGKDFEALITRPSDVAFGLLMTVIFFVGLNHFFKRTSKRKR